MRALRRDVTRLTGDAGPLNRALSDAGRQAAEPIAERVRSTLPTDTGTLAGDVRVTASRTGAAVRVGRASIPYAGAVDFGGYPEGRPYQGSGRYLFPAAGDLASTAAELYADGTQKAIDAFAWSNMTTNPEGVHD